MSESAGRVVVVGGGIAGIATAAELATSYDITVVEQEFQPGYHSTGRSAAVLHLAFENDLVHRLTRMAEPIYRSPPQGFEALSEPLDHIAFDTADKRELVESFVENWIERCPWLTFLTTDELHDRAPLLNHEQVVGTLDTRSLRLHVDAILNGYRRQFIERGGKLAPTHRVLEVERRANEWRLTFAGQPPLECDILINAAGAWADEIAMLAGIPQLGLQPRRRTGVVVDPGFDCSTHPMCYRASGGIYFKPEGSNLMLSPADQTDSPPCDAQPDELDVAIVLDTLNRCTKAEVDRPVSTWAGLRSFVADSQPVIGWEPTDDQFFWVAALGGFGIQTAPAYAKVAARLIANPDTVDLDLVDKEELARTRLSVEP